MNDLPKDEQNSPDSSTPPAKAECSSDDPNCCSPGAPTGSSAGRRLRTVLFAAIVLTAATVTAYSLFAPGSSVEAGTSAADGEMSERAKWAGSVLGGNDFTFLVLAANEDGPDSRIVTEVRKAVKSISQKGAKITTRNLLPNDPAYAGTIRRQHVTAYPAVLAVMKGGGTMLLEGSIDEARLLKAYLSCSASCGSGSGCGSGGNMAGCAPSGCGK